MLLEKAISGTITIYLQWLFDSYIVVLFAVLKFNSFENSGVPKEFNCFNAISKSSGPGI